MSSGFTREFFEAAQARLAPGGVICQWANIYNISDRDLRSIAATFTAVFPHGTVWLVGKNDALFVATDEALDDRLPLIARGWSGGPVAADLRSIGAVEPFALLSMYGGGPDELKRYGDGAPILTDDRMALEFSAPRDVHSTAARDHADRLRRLVDDEAGPATVRAAVANASASEWRNRGAMMMQSDFYATACDAYVRALSLDPADDTALDGFVRAAVMGRRAADALSQLKTLTAGRAATRAMLIARSKPLAAGGAADAALAAAEQASAIQPVHIAALEQEASLVADAGEALQLTAIVERMRRDSPASAVSHYFDAVPRLLRGEFTAAVEAAERAITADPAFAPVYDVAGAAYTKVGQNAAARRAFETSLRFNAHDSTAYTNLGVLALGEGKRDEAVGFFAEALWLDPQSPSARQGLTQSRAPAP